MSKLRDMRNVMPVILALIKSITLGAKKWSAMIFGLDGEPIRLKVA